MRVQNEPLGESRANPAAGADGVPAARPNNPQQSGRIPGVSDRLDISSLAGRLAETHSALAADRAQRVAHVAAAYRAGHYRADAHQISRRMVEESIAAGGTQSPGGGHE